MVDGYIVVWGKPSWPEPKNDMVSQIIVCENLDSGPLHSSSRLLDLDFYMKWKQQSNSSSFYPWYDACSLSLGSVSV